MAGLWWSFGFFFPIGIWQIFPGFHRPILKLRRSNISIKWITRQRWNRFIDQRKMLKCSVICDWCGKYVHYFNFLTHKFLDDQEYVKVNFCNSVTRKQLSGKTPKCNESASRLTRTVDVSFSQIDSWHFASCVACSKFSNVIHSLSVWAS